MECQTIHHHFFHLCHYGIYRHRDYLFNSIIAGNYRITYILKDQHPIPKRDGDFFVIVTPPQTTQDRQTDTDRPTPTDARKDRHRATESHRKTDRQHPTPYHHRTPHTEPLRASQTEKRTTPNTQHNTHKTRATDGRTDGQKSNHQQTTEHRRKDRQNIQTAKKYNF